MNRLMQLIAQNEGFGPSKNLPTRRNNPGDLRHSPHSSHAGIGPNDIGIIDTLQHGWADLERQLDLYAARGLRLVDMVDVYAPPDMFFGGDMAHADHNNTAIYLRNICMGLGLPSSALVADAMKVKAV